MKIARSGSLRGGFAMALASTQFVPSYLSPHLLAAGFSLNLRPTSDGHRSCSTSSLYAEAKMDQSFLTWRYDEPCTTMAWTDMPKASLKVVYEKENWDNDADLIFVGVFAPKQNEDEEESENEGGLDEALPVTLSGEAQALDVKLGGALSSLMAENSKEFKNGSKAGSTTPTLRLYSEGRFKRYILMGLGKLPDGDDDTLLGVSTAIGQSVATKCHDEKNVASAKVLLPEGFQCGGSVLTDISSSFYANMYSDNRFRTGDNVQELADKLETVTFVSESGSVDENSDESLEAGKKLASGVYMAKDIVNAPHNVLNSLGLADTARRLAEESGGSLKCKILGKKECEERGMVS